MMGKLCLFFLFFLEKILAFNFLRDSETEIFRYKVGCDLPGKYRVALDSDALEFGGHGRVRKRVFSPLLLNIFVSV